MASVQLGHSLDRGVGTHSAEVARFAQWGKENGKVLAIKWLLSVHSDPTELVY